ncbi:MAG: hypothetical protein L3J20_10315 [Flavobacteriaceae bacterium]|nr:hypothetical protein [Flavobacteriaceae bacterium]
MFAKLSFKTPIFKVKGGGNDWVSALNRTIEYKALGNMTIQVLSKNGRYKYFIEVSEVEKIEKLNNGNYARRKKTKDIQNQEIKNYINKFTNSIIEDIKKHMITESDFENNEW